MLGRGVGGDSSWHGGLACGLGARDPLERQLLVGGGCRAGPGRRGPVCQCRRLGGHRLGTLARVISITPRGWGSVEDSGLPCPPPCLQ